MKYIVLLILNFVLLGCNAQSTYTALIPENTFELHIKEPSGISFLNKALYIISDRNGNVYKTNLQGKIIDKIKTDLKDLEGIAVDSKERIYVLNEGKRTINRLKKSGKIAEKFKIKGDQKRKNSGLEGVCFDPENSIFYAVNEKKPRELLKLSKEGTILATWSIDFVNDLSGICYDTSTNSLWIVSDESKGIVKVTTEGQMIKRYAVNIQKAEGIVVEGSKIYVVSDSENKLYIFQKPD